MNNRAVTDSSEAVEVYLRQPYARIIIPECDGTYRSEIMEFPGCIATGDSPDEALVRLEEVARSWLSAALEAGQDIPNPIETSNDFSGRFVLRLPKSLHKKSSWIAEREGVSLNQLIVASLAESIGERRARIVASNIIVSAGNSAPPPTKNTPGSAVGMQSVGARRARPEEQATPESLRPDAKVTPPRAKGVPGTRKTKRAKF